YQHSDTPSQLVIGGLLPRETGKTTAESQNKGFRAEPARAGESATRLDSTAPARLTRGLGRLFNLLRHSDVGHELSEQELKDATGWSDTTLATYERKNKLTAFIRREPSGAFR